MSQIETKLCTLYHAHGRHEPCTRERCAFWEDGGAVLPGNCLVERLGIDVRNPGLAEYLLEVRERVERARDRSEAEAARRNLSRRLGRDTEGRYKR